MTSSARHVVVGTAGHIDHGKSTLVRALTGTDPDRLPEEKRRGITIDLGFAHTAIEDLVFSFVDVPGHERFVHNMLAGATGIDLLLLVVAADESVMPQTREHLSICRLLGLSAGVVALTRIDLCEPGFVDLAEEEVRGLLLGTFLAAAPLVRVSGATLEGLPSLRRALVEAARRQTERESGPWARLPVDRVFAARGFGTVVTGTLQGGTLVAGQNLVAIPAGPSLKLRGLQVHGQTQEQAGPNRRVAANLQGVSREELTRGMVLVPPGREVTTLVFDALVEVLAESPAALEEGQRVRLHHGTAEVMGRLRLPEEAAIPPGGRGVVQARLEGPLAALPGDRFILRRYSPVETLGGGQIVDIDPPRWRRSDAAWPERAELLAAAGPGERLATAAQEAGEEGIELGRRAPRLALEPGRALELARDLTRMAGEGPRFFLLPPDRLIGAEGLRRLQERVLLALADHHKKRPLEPGLAPERLRGMLAPNLGPEAFRALLELAAARGVLSLQGECAGLPGHQGSPTGELAGALERVLAELERAGLEAVEEARLIALCGPGGRDVLAFAARSGRARKLRGDLWLAGSVWNAVVSRLELEAARGRTTLDVPAFKDLFGLTRRVAIPLLERLDDEKITLRVGNERRIRVAPRPES